MSQLSYRQQTATGADINFTIDTFSSDELKVYVDGVLKTAGVHYNINPYNSNSQSTVDWIGTAPSSPSIVRIVRETDVLNTGNTAVEGRATYEAGSSVKAADLNNNQKQVLRSLQEHNDQLIQTYDIEPDAITSAVIADSQINSEHYVDGSIDREHLAADIVDGTKIADDSINSEHYVNGSIDEEHIANSAVTSNKIADNAVTTTEILNGAVTRAKLEADIIDGTKLADNAVDSEHYTDGSIDRVHLAADAIDGTKLADNSINSEHYVDGSIDRVHLEADIIDSTKLADDAVGSEHIQANAVTDSEIATGTLDNRYYTKTQSDAAYFNVSTGDTIKDGDTFPDNDTTIATTAAINDRIIDLVDDVGGFVPIANETSFPTSNPDVNDGAGTIVSVSAASTNLVPSGTTVTIANGRGSGLAVIITGVSATIPSGFGFLVETTTTDHTYAFHRLSPKATEVTTVATNATQVQTVHTNITQVQTVHNNITDIQAVAADASDIGAVAAKATEIGRLGTADAVADMAILGTADVVADMAILGTTDVVADLNTLGTADVVADLNTLGTADVVSDMNALATSDNITAMDTCRDNISSITNCSTNISSVNTFGDQYQVAANNPSTDGGGNALAAGDLYFNTSANELKVYNGSSWQGGVTASGSFAATTGNTFTGDNRYNDNVKALFGTGSDMEIFHYNGFGFITNTDGILHIRSVDGIKLQDQGGNEVFVNCIDNAAVELFYDNVKKLETTSAGATVTGRLVSDGLNLGDGENLKLGTDDDCLIEHTGSGLEIDNNTGGTTFDSIDTIHFRVASGNESAAKFIPNGAVELYHNGVKKLETVSNGVQVAGMLAGMSGNHLEFNTESAHEIRFRTNGTERVVIQTDGHLKPYVDSTYDLGITGTRWRNVYADTYYGDGSNLTGINTDLVADTSPQLGGNLDCNGNDITGNGNIDLPDNSKIKLGTDDDLQIYHNGSHSYITNATNTLYIRSADTYIQDEGGNETNAKFINNGAVELYHDNFKSVTTDTNGLIVNGPEGDYGAIFLYADEGDDDADKWAMFALASGGFKLQNYTSGSWEDNLKATGNGAVELYYDNSKKLETTVSGAKISGHLYLDDDYRLRLGTDDDLNIYHNNSANTNEFTSALSTNFRGKNLYFYVNHNNSSESAIMAYANAQTELYYDNSKKFETNSSGIAVTEDIRVPDNGTIYLGTSDDMQIVHTPNNGYFKNTTGSLYIQNATQNTSIFIRAREGEESIKTSANSNVELYFDNSKKFETTTNGAVITGSLGLDELYLGDSEKIKVGANDDLQIHHSSNASIIEDTYGDLRIHSNSVRLQSYTGGEKYFDATVNGDVELYYDNNQKLKTVANGVQVNGYLAGMSGDHLTFNTESAHDIRFRTNGTLRLSLNTSGHLYPYVNNTYDLGTSSNRFRNVYTNDLHLSNQGSSNDVDGTWGDWTMQEGESDLFLKNNRSGKKYKFNLTEVS